MNRRPQILLTLLVWKSALSHGENLHQIPGLVEGVPGLVEEAGEPELNDLSDPFHSMIP